MKSCFKPISPFPDLQFAFLDRDGVVNRKPPEGKYIADWSEFDILPGVEDAIARLNRNGCRVLVISNQRGIALGLCRAEGVNEIHERLQNRLMSRGAHIDGFYLCPHDTGQCDCRKPEIGLFLQATRRYPQISADNSIMIGDALSDIQAAQRFGCRSVFIEGDPTTRKSGAEAAARLADGTAESLLQAVNSLLGLDS